jgi:hypothetical protein
LSTNAGSVDTFHDSIACGFSPNARQIRDTAIWFSPDAWAIDRVEQCVSPLAGLLCRVRSMIASTWSSVIVRGLPGCGSSSKPSSRSARKRDRHFVTLDRPHPSDAQDAMTASVSGTLDETPERVSVAASADVMVWVAARPADRSDCSDGGCWLPRVKG